MRIRLTDERRAAILSGLQELYFDRFDEDLSEFRAEQVLNYFVRSLGPAVYNQAIQDARAFLQERLADLDATFYEPMPEE
ncbi:MAG: DUF2164 domain-containing protein [Phycisphaerae bacterium]